MRTYCVEPSPRQGFPHMYVRKHMYCTIDGNMNYVVAEPGAALPLAAAH